jgi:hypothetical protein
MYFDFWDNRPDTPRLSSPMTAREKGLMTVVVHLLLVILVLVWPELPWVKAAEARRQQELEARRIQRIEQPRESPRFVFMQPKIEMRATPPERAELSDLDRRAQSVERPVDPKNSLPFARGNTTERIEADPVKGPREKPEPPAPPTGGANGEAAREVPPLPDATTGLTIPRPDTTKPQMRGPSTGVLAEAIRNVQKYVGQESFDNQQGRAPDANFPSIQFDSKGVEFGPWLRRFVAQNHRSEGDQAVVGRRLHELRVQRAGGVEPYARAAAGVPRGPGVLHRHVLLQRNTG